MSPQMFFFSVMMYSAPFLLTLLKFPVCYFIFIAFCNSIPSHAYFPRKLYIDTCWAIIAHPAPQTFIIIQGRMLLLLISIESAFRIPEMSELRVFCFVLFSWIPLLNMMTSTLIHGARDNGISSWQYSVCAHFP